MATAGPAPAIGRLAAAGSGFDKARRPVRAFVAGLVLPQMSSQARDEGRDRAGLREEGIEIQPERAMVARLEPKVTSSTVHQLQQSSERRLRHWASGNELGTVDLRGTGRPCGSLGAGHADVHRCVDAEGEETHELVQERLLGFYLCHPLRAAIRRFDSFRRYQPVNPARGKRLVQHLG